MADHAPPYGTPEALRQVIDETMWFIGTHAEAARLYAQTGSDAGLTFAVRNIVAYVKLAIGSTRDLEELKARLEARKGGADA